MEKKIKFVCAKCGSDHILMDAFAIWDVDLQEWVLNSTHEATYCQGKCNGDECDVDEVEIKDGDILIPVNEE